MDGLESMKSQDMYHLREISQGLIPDWLVDNKFLASFVRDKERAKLLSMDIHIIC